MLDRFYRDGGGFYRDRGFYGDGGFYRDGGFYCAPYSPRYYGAADGDYGGYVGYGNYDYDGYGW